MREVISWDNYFLNMCEVVKSRSKDEETQVGCVITDKSHRVLSTGYNSFPAGCKDSELPATRPDKYPYMIHAEINAILYARTSLMGCHLYCSFSPCIDCSKAIIASGIEKVIFSEIYKEGFEKTRMLFDAAGYVMLGYSFVKQSPTMEDWSCF